MTVSYPGSISLTHQAHDGWGHEPGNPARARRSVARPHGHPERSMDLTADGAVPYEDRSRSGDRVFATSRDLSLK